MTICIAAIATENNKEFIVFATDHMISTEIGSFEHTIDKFKEINTNTIAMLAGNPMIFNDLVKVDASNISYNEIKSKIFENFCKKRKQVIKRELLDIYGINEEFIIGSLANEIPNSHVNRILTEIARFRLETTILLVGFDSYDKAQISQINEENLLDFRDMNFCSIGSGDMQAMNTLLFQKHDKRSGVKETLYNVYKAKRNAEVMEGVGKELGLWVLSNKIHSIKEKDINILEDIYNKELQFGKTHNKLNKLNLSGI